jgi:diaminopimelate decarboxylase
MRIQGIDCRELAEQFGTPLYVYDADRLTEAITGLRSGLPVLEVFCSLKANPNIGVFGVLRAGGARAEVCSLVELRTAIAAGAEPENIIFVGPGKSERELEACVAAGIYAIVCESLDELGRIDRIAGRHGTRQRVLLRVNPASSAPGARLAMGGKPRQFGIDEAEVLAARDIVSSVRHARVAGVHVYQGTRILDPLVIAENTRYALDLADRVADALGIPLEAVDIGGGLGVAYFDGESDLDLPAVVAALNPLLDTFVAAHPGTRMIMESGRYLTACAGVYLVSVRYLKQSMGERFAITDGGTHHHLAAVGIGSFVKRNFPIALANRDPDGETVPWHITGPLCTPNDTLGKNVPLPRLRVGDLLAVLRSGAYGPSASPGLFLSHGYPAEVLVLDGRAHLVRRRDAPEDLLRMQHLPDLDRLVDRAAVLVTE